MKFYEGLTFKLIQTKGFTSPSGQKLIDQSYCACSCLFAFNNEQLSCKGHILNENCFKSLYLKEQTLALLLFTKNVKILNIVMFKTLKQC